VDVAGVVEVVKVMEIVEVVDVVVDVVVAAVTEVTEAAAHRGAAAVIVEWMHFSALSVRAVRKRHIFPGQPR
jgi:hypothetical protein